MKSKHIRSKNKLLGIALILGVFTIVYNLLEGIVSTYFGYEDETLALFGFGIDSFVEVISGTGIVHMIMRMRRNTVEYRDKFEITALKITGTGFYILTIGLIIGVILKITAKSVPETTLIGIIVSSVSIITMYFLMNYKLKIGTALDSDPIIADANCTKICFYLSFILLTSSILYEVLGIRFIDEIGSLGIAWIAFNEAKESFEKARNKSLVCECH
jgi:divalent metal cation (Fe/Co/Zn/Cd) transporter